MADLGGAMKKLFTSLLSPKGNPKGKAQRIAAATTAATTAATAAATAATATAAAAQPAAPITLTYNELVAQYQVLEKENADKDAEINRLGNLKPPPIPAPASVHTGTIANIPANPPLGGNPASKVQVKQNTGTKQAPPLQAAANVAAQHGGAMPPIPIMGNIIMYD